MNASAHRHGAVFGAFAYLQATSLYNNVRQRLLRLRQPKYLIGAVVGEYISSKVGLGYMIYNAGALYDLNGVFVGIFCLMALALVLDAVLGKVEARFKW